jgi:hypothetical protein
MYEHMYLSRWIHCTIVGVVRLAVAAWRAASCTLVIIFACTALGSASASAPTTSEQRPRIVMVACGVVRPEGRRGWARLEVQTSTAHSPTTHAV